MSFVEARELARIPGTNLAGLEVALEALENVSHEATSGKVPTTLMGAPGVQLKRYFGSMGYAASGIKISSTERTPSDHSPILVDHSAGSTS